MDIEASPPHTHDDGGAAYPGPPSTAADQPSPTPPAATAKPAPAAESAAAEPAASQPGPSGQAAAGASDQQAASGSAEAEADAEGPSQQDVVDNAAVTFTPGTVVQFDLDPEDASKSSGLDFRAVRPVFGGMEGGVRHCDFRSVSAHTSLYKRICC